MCLLRKSDVFYVVKTRNIKFSTCSSNPACECFWWSTVWYVSCGRKHCIISCECNVTHFLAVDITLPDLSSTIKASHWTEKPRHSLRSVSGPFKATVWRQQLAQPALFARSCLASEWRRATRRTAAYRAAASRRCDRVAKPTEMPSDRPFKQRRTFGEMTPDTIPH